MGVSLCSLYVFNIFDTRLFLVWMPVASLLSVCWSLPPRGAGCADATAGVWSGSGSGTPLEHAVGAAAARDHPWGLGGWQ